MTRLPPQGQDDGQQEQGGQLQGPHGGDDRPTLEELRQRSVVLGEQIAQHLARGQK